MNCYTYFLQPLQPVCSDWEASTCIRKNWIVELRIRIIREIDNLIDVYNTYMSYVRIYRIYTCTAKRNYSHSDQVYGIGSGDSDDFPPNLADDDEVQRQKGDQVSCKVKLRMSYVFTFKCNNIIYSSLKKKCDMSLTKRDPRA